MVKPLAIVLTIVFLGLFITYSVNRSIVHTMCATGLPFDHMGEIMKCQLCKTDGARMTSGYGYRCKACRRDFRARWNEAARRIDVDW